MSCLGIEEDDITGRTGANATAPWQHSQDRATASAAWKRGRHCSPRTAGLPGGTRSLGRMGRHLHDRAAVLNQRPHQLKRDRDGTADGPGPGGSGVAAQRAIQPSIFCVCTFSEVPTTADAVPRLPGTCTSR